MTTAIPVTMRDTDAAIIVRSVRDPECFAEVFDRYYVPLSGFLARRLGQTLADDLASETFLVAFARRERYDIAYPDARPWLYGIASNLIARHHRAELRHQGQQGPDPQVREVSQTSNTERGRLTQLPNTCSR